MYTWLLEHTPAEQREALVAELNGLNDPTIKESSMSEEFIEAENAAFFAAAGKMGDF